MHVLFNLLCRVIVSAVCKKTTNLKLHFFSNHSEINKLNRSGLQAATNEPTVDADIGKCLSALVVACKQHIRQFRATMGPISACLIDGPV